MDIVPLKEYKRPEYPDKIAVLKTPKLLKTLPERWRSNACVCAALGTLMVASLTSCAQKAQQNGNSTVETSTKAAGGGNEKKPVIAPVFEHGQGRGSFGCDSVAPPSFLSEEEAFQVIQEEARQYGISFERNGLEIKKVGIPKTSFIPEESHTVKVGKSGVLTLDGYDAERKLGFEFISEEDYRSWSVGENGTTVESYDFLSTAKALKEGLAGKSEGTTVGVFYDPMTGVPEEVRKAMLEQQKWTQMGIRAKELAREDLKKQVKDFLEWLKAQEIM